MTDAIRTPDELLEDLPGFPWAPRYRQVDGLRLAHVDEGDGAPVVMWHGEPTWGYLWRKVAPALLDAGHRVVLPDLAGLRPLRQADRSRLVHVRPPHGDGGHAARGPRPARRDVRRPRLGWADRPAARRRAPRAGRPAGDHGHRPAHRPPGDERCVAPVRRVRGPGGGAADRLPRAPRLPRRSRRRGRRRLRRAVRERAVEDRRACVPRADPPGPGDGRRGGRPAGARRAARGHAADAVPVGRRGPGAAARGRRGVRERARSPRAARCSTAPATSSRRIAARTSAP